MEHKQTIVKSVMQKSNYHYITVMHWRYAIVCICQYLKCLGKNINSNTLTNFYVVANVIKYVYLSLK